MARDKEALAAALQRLRALGFRAVRTNPSTRAFEGLLRCKQGEVPIRLEISDWDFVRYPRIRVRERPDFFPPLMPHISADGVLCYFADGGVVLDRYHPDDALWQCLEQARLVLERAIDDPQYRSDEFRGEFWANWALAQHPIALPCLIGSVDAAAKEAKYYLVGPEGGERLFIAADPQDAERFCEALGWSPPAPGIRCWLFRSERLPALPVGGLPSTIRAIFEWLKLWDRNLYQAVQNRLGERTYLSLLRCELAIATPVGWIGFGFDLDSVRARFYRRKPRDYRNYLHRRGANTPIDRRVFEDVSPGHVYARNLINLKHGTLAGKRIALIGCGAIGGYLASALVRLGAGTGGGLLQLQDIDELRPDNLGRHRLGYDSLFLNKAEALKNVLAREAPYSSVVSVATSAVASFPTRFELVINATGEQAVSEALNAQHVRSDRRAPLLHTWVYGNGDCVQGLWVDSTKQACYRCLRHHDEAQYGQSRFPLGKTPVARAFVGCNAFTPYAVSAPMAAAALAADFVADWLKGDVSPRFRLRYCEASDLRRFKNQDVAALHGCPACQQD